MGGLVPPTNFHNCRCEIIANFYLLILDPWINLISFDKAGSSISCYLIVSPGQWKLLLVQECPSIFCEIRENFNRFCEMNIYILFLMTVTMLHYINQEASHCKESSTLPLLKLQYSTQTRSTPWLLMPCLPVLPSHQQPQYWLCTIMLVLVFHKEGFQVHEPSQYQEMEGNVNMFLLTHLPRTKWPPFPRHFSNAYSWMKSFLFSFNFNSNFIGVCS